MYLEAHELTRPVFLRTLREREREECSNAHLRDLSRIQFNMTLHGYAILSYKRERRKREGVLEPMYSGARDLSRSVLLRTLLEKRERRKREGVLEPMYSGARDLTRSVLLRTLLEKRERGRKRGGLKPNFLEARELTQSGFYGLLMDQSAT